MGTIKFNEQQIRVINFKEGNCCVMAGAGAGKSTTLIARVEKLIESGVDPSDIMMITFTRNSANDLKRKLYKKHITDVKVGTFHSICSKILSQEIKGFSTEKRLPSYVIENCFKKINNKININEMLRAIDYQRANLIGVYDEYLLSDFDFNEDEIREFYKAYEELKKNKSIMDFTDWLLKTKKILENDKTNKYTVKYILVDESQDCNLINHELTKLLCPNNNIMMVGDVRQSIYGFRAAVPKLFMDFDKVYKNATVLHIDDNYRSTSNIVNNANNFIKPYFRGYKHYSDSMPSNKKEGDIQLLSSISKDNEAIEIAKKIEQDLKNGIAPSEIGILYRNNNQSDCIERELKLKEIEYYIEKKDSFFERREIKLIVCMLRLIQDPDDDSAYEYIYKKGSYPLSFMTNKTLQAIIDKSAILNISFLEASDIIKTTKPHELKNILKFKNMYNSLSVQYKKNIDLDIIINNIIKSFRLKDFINENYEGEELDDRLEGLVSFKKFIRNNTLDTFLKFVYKSESGERKKNSNQVQMMTIHKSKGLEFEKVYLIGVQDDKFPSKKSSNLQEEARLMYVACTRSKRDLTISEIGFGNQFIEEYFGKAS